MKRIFIVFAIAAGFASVAHADVWKWVDANGDTHFVDTDTPIYTWVDESGSVHYSDTPDHEDAVSAELIWVAPGSLDDLEEDEAGSVVIPGETDEDRIEREQAEAYYCKRATEIYESYMSAPRLYKTNEAGEREYLSKEEAAKTIAETRAQKDEMCR